MLVLSRKLYESIRIGPNIIITVVGFRGDSVCLGLEAPKKIKIVRTELELSPVRPEDQAVADYLEDKYLPHPEPDIDPTLDPRGRR